MLTRKRALCVIIVVLGFLYGVAFAGLVRDFHIGYVDRQTGRPDIGYYYSDTKDVNVWCHRLFWPLSRLLELTGRWAFSADAFPGPDYGDVERASAGVRPNGRQQRNTPGA